jgi:EpsI family protein
MQVLSFATEDREVAVVVALFRNQRQGAELVTSTNQLVSPANARWHLVARRAIELADARGTFPARAALIRGQGTQLVAAQWYWLGTSRTTSDTVAKLDLAIDRLLARGDTSAWVIVVAPARDGFDDALPVIADFVREVGARLDGALAEVAAR